MQRQVTDSPSVKTRGQAMVEYALILALIALALAAIFVVTGSAVGNVFSNTVYNLVGQDPNAIVQLDKYGGPEQFWATVTWVAEHPQQPPEVDRVIVPGGGGNDTSGNDTSGNDTSGNDTSGNDTNSTSEATVPVVEQNFLPTAVPTDAEFGLPFFENVDSSDTLKRWRLDNSVYLGGKSWKGEYFSNQSFSGTPDQTLWNYQIDSKYALNVDFNWGTTGYPIQTASFRWPSDRAAGFSIRYTRDITLDTDMRLRFSAAAADSIVVKLDGSAIIDRESPASMATYIAPVEMTVTAGAHTLEIDYVEIDGQEAGVSLVIVPSGGTTGTINPDDVTNGSTDSTCEWGRLSSTNSDSLQWMFDDDTTSSEGVGPNLTCNLELRGRINLNVTNPVLSFWDVWDFSGSSASAKLQVAEYQVATNVPLTLNRGAVNWTTYDLHSPGEANYNWTRQVVNLSAFAGKRITMRFVITNPSGTTGTRRWYIDDIGVAQQDAPGTDTDGKFWDLNSTSQTSDFLYDARWSLTNYKTYGGSGTAWDDSYNYAPAVFSEGSPRVHYIELKSLVTLVGAPNTDIQGDTGEAELSFWSTYNINTNTRIQVEWTTDSRDHTTHQSTDTWHVLGNVIADSSGGPINGGATMTFYQFPLGAETGVPQTEPFRLRFVMYLDTTSTWSSSSGGWWIDNIYLERASPPAYAPYPFTDNAESASTLTDQWLTPGSWARVSNQGRESSNPHAYTDSPAGNYQPNVNNPIQMSKYLDLNNDTAGHATKYASTPNRPTLTFWHWRNIASGTTIYVDMYITKPGEEGGSWYPIWQYAYGQSGNPIAADDQEAWERVQIDLIQAYQDASGLAWSTIIGNGSTEDSDDDVRIAFRVQSTGSSVADGLYIDQIDIRDYSEDEFHLWPTDTPITTSDGVINGSGTTYTDDAEGQWYDRWYYGGEWNSTSSAYSGLAALTDSPNTNYRSKELSIMEMKKIIDLRGVDASVQPVMYAWMIRKIDDSDTFSWQISQRDGSTTQSYDKIYGWSNWQPVLSTVSVANPNGLSNDNELWHRIQINLAPYAGQEIKLRLVLDTTNQANSVADGIYLDEIRFTYVSLQRTFQLPFFDSAQSTFNWVTEGKWGLAPDRYKGSGGGSVTLGNNQWQAAFVSCDVVDATNLCNNLLDNFDAVETAATNSATTATSFPSSVLTNQISEPLVLSYNSTIRPFGATDPKWSTQWVAHLTRIVTVESATTLDFSILADDGVRAKIEGPVDPLTGLPTAAEQFNPTGDWNLANEWSIDGSIQQVDLTQSIPGGTYKITVDWAQNGGSAFMSFGVTESNYAFTDSPNTPNSSGGFDYVKSPSHSDTSLLLNGALDLTTHTRPLITYSTEYDIGTANQSSSTLARFEVSNDGGFTWTQNHLTDNNGPLTMDSPTFVGGKQLTSWLFRQHNLTAYVGGYLNMRFRLLTQNQPDSQSTFGWHDGWYITEINVNE